MNEQRTLNFSIIVPFEDVAGYISNAVKGQMAFNRKMAVLSMLTAAYIVTQVKKIKALECEIEELKREKGE